MNVKPEIEAFDPGMIANAAYYLKKGVLKAPLHFQFCMGCANGIPGSVKKSCIHEVKQWISFAQVLHGPHSVLDILQWKQCMQPLL
ncbi:MAG: 3-keto-5-aminohexanoate cleavage protein [Coprococcus sp.]